MPSSTSTWEWLKGVSGSASTATDWTLVSGPGNGFGVPQAGDTIINAGGTIVLGIDPQFVSNTVELGGTAGVALLVSVGDTAVTEANPSIDANSLIENAVSDSSTPETSAIDAAGVFVNDGTIAANGPAGSVFAIAISGTVVNGTFQDGDFVNNGLIEVDAGNSMTISVDANSELFNNGAIVANGGTLTFNAAAGAIGGGFAPVAGAVIIENGGVVETNAAYAVNVTGTTEPIYEFADAGPGNTLKIDNLNGSSAFGGAVLGFGAGDTIDLGMPLAIGKIVYSQTTGILNLQTSAGAILASLDFASGNFLSGTIGVSGNVAGSFAIGTGTDGNTVLTTTVQNDYYANNTGAWQAGGAWSNGVPIALTTAIIGQGATSAFTLTTGGSPVSIGALVLVSSDAFLQITSNMAVSPYVIEQFSGTIEVAAGQTLTGTGLQMFGGTTQIDANAVINLTGHSGLTTVGDVNGMLTAIGTIGLQNQQGTLAFGGGTLSAAGIATNAALISGYGTFIGQLGNSGTIAISGGVFAISGSLDNTGQISGGLFLSAGSRLTNEAIGTITNTTSAALYGISGAVAIVNAGLIDGGGNGINLTQGGSVNNSGTIQVTGAGVFVGGAVGTVVNSGTIRSGNGSGVALANGGYVTNQSQGYIYGGVSINGALARTIVNFGSIANPTGNGVFVQFGYVGNKGGVISGSTGVSVNVGTLVNTGTVIGTSVDGASLTDSSSVINGRGGATGALISGLQYGVQISGASGYVNNAATIAASGANGTGLRLSAGGTIINTGTITGSKQGIYLDVAASVTNGQPRSTLGVISGASGIDMNGAGTIFNYGKIAGTSGSGLYLSAGGGVTNYGSIDGAGANGIGVNLSHGGDLTNGLRGPSAGMITAGHYAVSVGGVGGTVVNFGSIVGPTGVIMRATTETVMNYGAIFGNGANGVYMTGGNVTNALGGLIAGMSAGVNIGQAAGNVVNKGTIIGTAGASTGVALFAGSTLTNAGAIIGATGGAVSFGNLSTNRLIVDPGAYFKGMVQGGGGVVELAVGNGSAGTLAAFGGTITNFATLQFDAGAKWTVEGGAANLSGIITGVTVGDTIDVDGFVAVGKSYTGNALVLTDALNNTITLGIQGNFTTGQFTISGDNHGGTDMSIACFRRGTLILTDRGEVPVEELAIGNLVVTLSGDARPIRWIGNRAYDGRFIAGNRDILPIRMVRDAIMKGVPARDLWVSPEHSLYLDGVLVQAKHLVNGGTVVQADRVDEVEYFHIELDTHDVIYADGAPTETFVDCDNRLMFGNGAEYASLYPGDDRPRWQFCAPRLEWGCAELIAIRAWMFERAAAWDDTHDDGPDVHLVVDGETVAPVSTNGGTYRFNLARAGEAVWLNSRHTVPAEREAGSHDMRRLGVAVESIVLFDADLSVEAWHGHPSLREGFHAAEPAHRWTDGHARIPDALLRPFPGALTVEVRLAGQVARAAAEVPRFRPPATRISWQVAGIA